MFDKYRNRAYIVTKTNVLVFDESAGSYLSPITPPTANNVLDLYDAALSVDGNSLIVTNRGDESVAVVDLTTGSSYVIATPYVGQPVNATCSIGSGPVAALAGNKALVLPIITNSNCYSAYYGAIVDLRAHTASSLSLGFSNIGWNVYRAQLQSNADGSLALITMTSGSAASYSPVSGFGAVQNPIGYSSDAISGDGNIMSADLSFADSAGRLIGTVAQPPALYQGPLTGGYPAAAGTVLLRGARFDAAGGLYFAPHVGYFEVIDPLSASLRMRFSLTQTVQDIPRPIAIDDGGRRVFLVTNEGLTVVDMRQAPLSIGHLGATSPVSGGTIQVRGSGFDANTTVMVDTTSVTASLVDENTINVTLPVLTSGAHDLTFKRNDGSSVTIQTLILIP